MVPVHHSFIIQSYHPKQEQLYYANNWFNSYQFHLDTFTIGTENDYTLKNLNKENYHYLNQFVLPDENIHPNNQRMMILYSCKVLYLVKLNQSHLLNQKC